MRKMNFHPSSVLQLIKSQKFLNKLVILVETEKEKTVRKEYVFADSKVSDDKPLRWAKRGVRDAQFLRLAVCLEVGTMGSLSSHNPFPTWESQAQEAEGVRSRPAGIQASQLHPLPLLPRLPLRECIIYQPCLTSPEPHWGALNFPGMHPEALRGTPDLNLSLNQCSLHFYTLPYSAEVRVPARPGCWNKRWMGRWRNLGSGRCGGPLYRRCLCDLIPHFRHANQGLKPTLTALLFILQCTARMRQGTESSQHVRCWLTVSAPWLWDRAPTIGSQGQPHRVPGPSSFYLCGRGGLLGGQWRVLGCPELAERVKRTGRNDKEGTGKNKEVGARQVEEAETWLGIVLGTWAEVQNPVLLIATSSEGQGTAVKRGSEY